MYTELLAKKKQIKVQLSRTWIFALVLIGVKGDCTAQVTAQVLGHPDAHFYTVISTVYSIGIVEKLQVNVIFNSVLDGVFV